MPIARRLPLFVVAAVLASCNSPGGPQVGAPVAYAQDVYAAEQTLETTEQLATSYIELPLCGTPTSPILCSETSVSAALKAADTKANADLALAKGITPTLTAASVLQDVATLAALIPSSKK